MQIRNRHLEKRTEKNRIIDYEIQRQKSVEKELDCRFIRINPDGKDFDMYVEIGKNTQSHNKSSKNLLIDEISKRLLEL